MQESSPETLHLPEENPSPQLRGEVLKSAIRKAHLRIGPFLALMFSISILDRSNVGFAKEALRVDAHINDMAYAVGAGVFFIGYAVFEVPSNLILRRVGARLWLSRIMVTWGIASALMILVRSSASFYVLRFIVGVAEAGFSPGVILYSTYWFPARERGKALGIYYIGLPAALAIGGPLSGWLLQVMKGYFGFYNWQWMFLLEGLLAVIVGVIAYFFLSSRPRDAKWLAAVEQNALEQELALEESVRVQHSSRDSFAALRDLNVIRFIAIYFTIQVGTYGVIFYLPSRLSELWGTQVNSTVGILVGIPWLCALLGLRWITRIADKKGQHRRLAVVMLALATVGLASSAYTSHIESAVLAFCLAAVGFVVVQPLFWTMPTAYLNGTAAAAGIAIIGALGNLGGFVGPTFKTGAEMLFHTQHAGMLMLSFISTCGILLLMSIHDPQAA